MQCRSSRVLVVSQTGDEAKRTTQSQGIKGRSVDVGRPSLNFDYGAGIFGRGSKSSIEVTLVIRKYTSEAKTRFRHMLALQADSQGRDAT